MEQEARYANSERLRRDGMTARRGWIFRFKFKDDLCDRITALLRDKPKGLPCWKIASLLCVDKKAIRPILCDNMDRLSKNFIFWKLK